MLECLVHPPCAPVLRASECQASDDALTLVSSRPASGLPCRWTPGPSSLLACLPRLLLRPSTNNYFIIFDNEVNGLLQTPADGDTHLLILPPDPSLPRPLSLFPSPSLPIHSPPSFLSSFLFHLHFVPFPFSSRLFSHNLG